MIYFRVEGEAVGKGRPRVTMRGKYAHAYTPKKTKDYEQEVKFAFLKSNCDAVPVYGRDTALRMSLTIACSVPKSYSKKKQAQCLDGLMLPTKKPDIDNIIKSIGDALNGQAFEDDSQIAMVYAEKIYAEEPYVDVMIVPIGQYDEV